MSFKKIFCLIINILCSIIIVLPLFLSKIGYNTLLVVTLTSLTTLCTVFAIAFVKFKNIKGAKITIICNVIMALIFTLYHILNIYNMLYIFKSINNFRHFIVGTGSKGILIYILIQAVQVVILPVPATIIALAGAIIYGPFWGSVYCSLGVLIGSFVAFWLGRSLGFKLVVWVAGKENAIKYANLINNNGKIFLGLAFLLPFFPDDILCYIAGITTMSFKYFFIVATLCRPIAVVFMCYFGGGYIIPFSGWGIYVWMVIAIVMSVVVYLTYKYQSQLEGWVISKFSKKKNKQQK